MKRKFLLSFSLFLVIIMLFSSISLALTAVPVKSIKLNKTNLTLGIGQTFNLTASVLPTNATNKKISWTTDKSSVATVSKTGVIKGVSTGKANITAKSSDGKIKAVCKISVVKAEPVKISILTQDSYDPDWPQSKGLPVVKELEKRTNVKINFQCVNVSQLANTVQTRLAAGTGLPDLVSVSSVPVSTLYNLGKQGVLLEIGDYMKKYAPNMVKTYNEFPGFKNFITAPDGKIYWFNYVQILEPEAYNGIWIRKDFLDKVGIGKLPETTDELYTAVKTMREKDANGNGKKDEVYMPYQWWQFEMTLPTSFGVPENAWNVDANGKVYFGRLSNGYRDFLMYSNKLFNEGPTDPEVATIPWDKYYAKFQNNIIVGAWNVPRGLQWLTENSGSKDAKLEYLPPLKGPDGKSLNVKQGVGGGGFYAITKNCKNPAAVMKFLDYIYSPEGEMLCKYGIEGVHYTKGADGKIVRTKEYLEGMKKANYSWTQGFGFATSLPLRNIQSTEEFIDINKDALLKSNIQPQTLIDIMNRYRKNAIEPYPYITSSDEENKQIEALGTDYTKYVDEMVIKFFMGKEPFSNWDAFVKKANELGYKKATEVEQAKYNRFKANKK